MDCDSITNHFNQLTMSSDDMEDLSANVYLDRSEKISTQKSLNTDFSDQRLNDVKQRLKARQAQRTGRNPLTTAKLISLDEAIQLHNEEQKQTEVRHSSFLH